MVMIFGFKLSLRGKRIYDVQKFLNVKTSFLREFQILLELI